MPPQPMPFARPSARAESPKRKTKRPFGVSLEKGEAERAFWFFVSGRAAHSTAWPFTTSRNTRPSLSAALRQSRVRSMKISK